MSYVDEAELRKKPIRSIIYKIWKPRTEIGRKLKHFLMTGQLETPERRYRRQV